MRKVTVPVGCVAILLLGGTLLAQPGPRGSAGKGSTFTRSSEGRAGMHSRKHHGRRGMRFLARYLELSDEQRDQIAGIMAEELAGMKEGAASKREQFRQIQEDLRTAMQQADFQEDAIRALLNERSVLSEDRQLAGLRVRHRIFWEVLTDEQREKAQDLLESLGPPMEGGFGGGAQSFGPPF